jgi:hypothetical protein
VPEQNFGPIRFAWPLQENLAGTDNEAVFFGLTGNN